MTPHPSEREEESKGEEREEKFNFCIGRYWHENKGALCIYTYGSEVHYGDMKEAEWQLNYVKSKNDCSISDEYKIFKLLEKEKPATSELTGRAISTTDSDEYKCKTITELAPKNLLIAKVRQFKKKHLLTSSYCKILYLFSDFVYEETVLPIQSQIAALQQTIEELKSENQSYENQNRNYAKQLSELSNGRKQEWNGYDEVMSLIGQFLNAAPLSRWEYQNRFAELFKSYTAHLSRFDVNDKPCTSEIL